jgi:hypothetical protein
MRILAHEHTPSDPLRRLVPGDPSLHLKVCFVKPRGSVSFASAAQAAAAAAAATDSATKPSNCAVIAENLSRFLSDAGFESRVEEFDGPDGAQAVAPQPAQQAVASPAAQLAVASPNALRAAASPAAHQAAAPKPLQPVSKVFSSPDTSTVYVLMIECTRDARAWIRSQKPARARLAPDQTVLVTSDRFFFEHHGLLSEWLVIEFAESGERYELTPSGTKSEVGLASQILNAISMKLVQMLARRGTDARKLKEERDEIEQQAVEELLRERGDKLDAKDPFEVLVEDRMCEIENARRGTPPPASPPMASLALSASVESPRLSSVSGSDVRHRRASTSAASATPARA